MDLPARLLTPQTIWEHGPASTTAPPSKFTRSLDRAGYSGLSWANRAGTHAFASPLGSARVTHRIGQPHSPGCSKLQSHITHSDMFKSSLNAGTWVRVSVWYAMPVVP